MSKKERAGASEKECRQWPPATKAYKIGTREKKNGRSRESPDVLAEELKLPVARIPPFDSAM